MSANMSMKQRHHKGLRLRIFCLVFVIFVVELHFEVPKDTPLQYTASSQFPTASFLPLNYKNFV